MANDNGRKVIEIPGAKGVATSPVGIPMQAVHVPHGGALTLYRHPNPAHVDNLVLPPAAITAGTLLLAVPPEFAPQVAAGLGVKLPGHGNVAER